MVQQYIAEPQMADLIKDDFKSLDIVGKDGRIYHTSNAMARIGWLMKLKEIAKSPRTIELADLCIQQLKSRIVMGDKAFIDANLLNARLAEIRALELNDKKLFDRNDTDIYNKAM